MAQSLLKSMWEYSSGCQVKCGVAIGGNECDTALDSLEMVIIYHLPVKKAERLSRKGFEDSADDRIAE